MKWVQKSETPRLDWVVLVTPLAVAALVFVAGIFLPAFLPQGESGDVFDERDYSPLNGCFVAFGALAAFFVSALLMAVIGVIGKLLLRRGRSA